MRDSQLFLLLFSFLTENRTSIKFLAVGDWGGVPYPPYITAVQKATAREMSKVAEQMGADFILALGDNFYYKGVDSVDSPRFKVSQGNLMYSEMRIFGKTDVKTTLWRLI